MASKPGERKTQILQTLAEMLEQPHASRITTAALAARLEVSEAALYRHFASKAQMFEGLIEFIETSIFTLVNQIAMAEPYGLSQAHQTVSMLLTFSERNKGMTRVLTGDALVTEDNRLQERINHINDRIEASIKQSLRIAVTDGGLLSGVKFGKDVIETETIVYRSITGTVRRIYGEHREFSKFQLD